MNNQGSAWNVNAGRKLSTDLPPFWPPKGALPGSGVCGEVREFTTSKNQEGKDVEHVILAYSVLREITDDGVGGPRARLVRRGNGMVTFTLNRGLRTAINPTDTPKGTLVQATFLRVNDELNGMREFEVRVVDGEYMLGVREASVVAQS